MFVATSGGASVAAWAPLLVAGGGLTVAFITGFARRDQRVVTQETTLDARTNTALKALSDSLDRTERERARCQVELEQTEKERNEWRDRAIAAEGKSVAQADRVEHLERQLQRAQQSIQESKSPPAD